MQVILDLLGISHLLNFSNDLYILFVCATLSIIFSTTIFFLAILEMQAISGMYLSLMLYPSLYSRTNSGFKYLARIFSSFRKNSRL